VSTLKEKLKTTIAQMKKKIINQITWTIFKFHQTKIKKLLVRNRLIIILRLLKLRNTLLLTIYIKLTLNLLMKHYKIDLRAIQHLEKRKTKALTKLLNTNNTEKKKS
jgi:hypothetical protein